MKKKILKKFIIILLIFTSFNTFPEDTEDNWKNKSNNFKNTSIAKDIVNADFNQLKSMAITLGLPDRDTAEEFRKDLSQYYGVELITSKKEKKGEKIILERAGELKTFKVEKEGDDILHIIGRVKIILTSKDENNKEVKKTIEAEEIYINTKTKEITGLTNVIFRDDTLEYEGKQFYYNFEISRGVLFEGRTQIKKGGESGLDGAYFKGEKVAQTGKEDIILYNGMLTTCEEENPHYSMNVSRLWLSGKGEWGLLNGIIYVGPVPFFYFPIYYHPKDLIVNPAFGFKSREGWYINTTFFALGDKDQAEEDTDSSSSSDDSSTVESISDTTLISLRRKEPTEFFSLNYSDIYTKLTNIYDTNDFYKKYPQFKIYPKLDSIDFHLNFFLDAYTNIGFYWGFYFYMNAKFTNSPFKFFFLSDYALSRRIWKDTETGFYVPYDPVDKNRPGYPNSTYYLLSDYMLSIFRTSQYVKLKGALFQDVINFDYDFQFEYLHDKNFITDYYNRELNFTYFDLVADSISYAIKSQSDEVSGVEGTKETEVTKNYENTNSYLSFNISPKNYPDIYGLKLLSNFIVNLETRAVFQSTEVDLYSEYNETDTDYENPLENRYLLESFSAPDIKQLKIEGTLLDYDVFMEMPDKINLHKNKSNDLKKTEKEKIIEDLYKHVSNISKIDETSDTTEIDYKLMLPFYSKITPRSYDDSKDILTYNKVLIGNEDISNFIYKKEDNTEESDKANAKDEYLKKYLVVKEIATYPEKDYNVIKPIDFDLSYAITEKMTNKFYFDTSTTNIEYEDLNGYSHSDTLQYFFYDSFRHTDNNAESLKELNDYFISSITKRFNVINDLNVTINGTLDLFKISDSPLLGFRPNFYISFSRHLDYIEIYEDYLTRINADDYSDFYSLIKDNLSNSSFSLKYQDTIVNDLSFGYYRFKGTAVTTNLNIDIFNHNLLKERNYSNLNEKNKDNDEYYQVSSIFYDGMKTYEKISKLESSFIFNVNIMDQNNPHQLSMGVGPHIKWVIPSSELATLKSDLWDDEKDFYEYENGTRYDNDNLTEAKEYIYYRSNGENLNSRIDTNFFNPVYFWDGPRYYRKMFENFSYNISYSYKKNNLTAVSLSNDIIFKLDNIGQFSDVYGRKDRFISVYPDDNFKVSFLNSIISYTMNISFTKEDNEFVDGLDSDAKKLDENKIMTMTNTHTFAFKIPGDIFEYKLKDNTNWLLFSYKPVFEWDRTIEEWADKSEFNYFYLDNQVLSLDILMNIIQIELTFKNFNFVDNGYGFELDSGTVDLGYKITEIPMFWRFFKLEIEPRVSYSFVVKHTSYYEDDEVQSYNINYYQDNSLSFSLNIDLSIGKGTAFETIFHFGVSSENNKMHEYYSGQGVSRDYWPENQSGQGTHYEYGLGAFFRDLADSFRFDNIEYRRGSPFNLKYIEFSVEHRLCDWDLKFKYIGQPRESQVSGRYNWENTFEFSVTWSVRSKNQLMKMFNKTKVDANYNYYDDTSGSYTGNWKQPIISIDPNED